MKKRMILALAALLVFGLSIATLAYKQTTATNKTAMSCCCCAGESCPMKAKSADGNEAASCCDNCDCCNGDSCPMMKKDADGNAVKMGDAKSCPMMLKEAAAATATKMDAKLCPMIMKNADGKETKMSDAHATLMKHDGKTDSKSCCCPCCQETMNKEKAAAPEV